MVDTTIYILQTRDGFRVTSQLDVDAIYYAPENVFSDGADFCDSSNFCEEELWKCFSEALFFETEQEAVDYAHELAIDAGHNVYNIFYLRYPHLGFPADLCSGEYGLDPLDSDPEIDEDAI